MGKQYKILTDKDIEFLKAQKLFYIASSSGKEVNLSPKGYDSIRVIDNSTLLYLGYPGSGNRTYRDAVSDGEFTLVFNSFDEKPMILRLFCKAKIVEEKSEEFDQYLKQFNEEKKFIRNFFIFEIYAVESSCGETIPYMEYKGERNSLKEWMVKMDKNNKLEKYKEDHFIPRNMKNI
ncbi:pyridoxamine 5'-phosphate oxidase family protein [bacterium]|nr:pyridoxamine 5'-phosphate oxidase family protein [bacterium]MBU1435311.1 pyridoxamine 5'-phosphate oxidase family protein [bacterium]MBU1503509.1 pyridoxamine 5'-phosphate oxidase family protein [bacterium]